MNRRTFIQSLGLLAGATAVPHRGIGQLIVAGLVKPSRPYFIVSGGKLSPESLVVMSRYMREVSQRLEEFTSFRLIEATLENETPRPV
jgi:hypothetical protein